MFGKIRKFIGYRFIIGVIAILLIVFFTERLHKTEAKQLHDINTYYKSVEIEKNDSLCGIANKFNSTEVQSNNSYIKEVMELNHLTDSNIRAGMSLVVPYYVYSE